MVLIVLDLEWNGAFSKKTHGYFNEIIEIGAVKLNDRMEQLSTFHCVIRPVVGRKLSSIVTDLTSITEEELAVGRTFPGAASLLRKWIGREEAVLLTWSTTDLSVLTENCRYFLGSDRIPFMSAYVDAQAYCQKRLGLEGSQQLGLERAAGLLEIEDGGLDHHRALDDSLLTAAVLRRLYDAVDFLPLIQKADTSFYERLNFKNVYIRDINSPLISRSDLRFKCEHCGRGMRRKGEWRFRNRSFFADFACRGCGRNYTARVQCRLKYEGLEVKRRLTEKLTETEANMIPTDTFVERS